jgi:hypothetical protein
VPTTSTAAGEMYRDDPLDDEAELREVVGDDAVDRLIGQGGADALLAALDALRILQGWVDQEACATWLSTPQRRLEDRSPLDALSDGAAEDVADVLRGFVASQS